MSKITAVAVPKWGIEMSEGKLLTWLKAEGDSVSQGDEVFEMESSKAINVWEAPADGVLRRQLAEVDGTYPVGQLLGVIAPADVDDEEIDAFIAAQAPVEAEPVEAEAPAAAPAAAQASPAAPANSPAPAASGSTQIPDALKQGGDDSACHATPHARRFAQLNGINLNNVSGTGRNERISLQDVEAAITAAGGSVATTVPAQRSGGINRSTADDSDVKATPVARRLAAEMGINLHDCRASGNRGRVCKADVEAANVLLNGAMPSAAAIASGAADAPEVAEEPMSGMRRTIGARLQSSKQNSPHFRTVVDCSIDNLLALRKQINSADPGVNLSVNDFVVKAVAMTLVKVPALNIQYDEASGTIRRFRDADISVAVALEEGLITPIVKAANVKSLSTISGDVRELVTKAKAGTLAPDEYQGGTFSISNLGMYGIKHFDAIINPPQAAILAVGAGEQRPVVENGELSVATVMTLTLSSDHRLIDGAPAAQFMSQLKRYIEQPSLMLA